MSVEIRNAREHHVIESFESGVVLEVQMAIELWITLIGFNTILCGDQ